MTKGQATPELPGMPTDAELRFAIVVPRVAKVALEPTAYHDEPGGVPSIELFSADPDRRRAFGSVPNLIKAPAHPDIEVTTQDVVHIQPASFADGLFKRRGRGKKVVDGIAFSPEEHSMFIFNMDTFLQRVSNRAEAKYAGSNETLRCEKPLLHRRDALQGRLSVHDRALDGYRGQWQSIHALALHAAHPGFANSTEGELRTLATEVWHGTMTTMLDVTANEKSWSQAERDGAQEALLRALLYGPQRGRVQNWQVMLKMAQKYTEAKGAAVARRRESINQRLEIINNELTDLYARTGFVPR